MRSNPDQTMTAYRESVRPRPSARTPAEHDTRWVFNGGPADIRPGTVVTNPEYGRGVVRYSGPWPVHDVVADFPGAGRRSFRLRSEATVPLGFHPVSDWSAGYQPGMVTMSRNCQHGK